MLRVDRITNQVIDVFISRVLASETDGADIAGKLQWHNGILWVQAYEYITGFNSSGQQVKQAGKMFGMIILNE